jgi:hypothetical protein
MRIVSKGVMPAAALAGSPAFGQAVPQIAFASVPDAIKLPKDLYLGEVSGAAVNSRGHICVFSRGNTRGPAYAAAAAQLLEFDANGNFLREISKNLYGGSFAHTVRVVQPRGQGAEGHRPQAGGVRRGHRAGETPEPAGAGRGRPLPPGHPPGRSSSSAAGCTRSRVRTRTRCSWRSC